MAEFSADAIFFSIVGGLAAGGLSHFLFRLQQNYSRNDDLMSETVSEAFDIIERCSEESASVWAGIGGSNAPAEQRLVCDLHDLATIVEFLKDKAPRVSLRVRPSLVNFRKAVSGDDFDVKGRQPDPARNIRIRSAAIELRMNIRQVQYDSRKFRLESLIGR